MSHRIIAAGTVALLALLPVSAHAEADAAPPAHEDLVAAMQANFIADLSQSFGPAVAESNAKGEPHFEVLEFEQESVAPAGEGCWKYAGEVTTVMRGVIPVPSEDSSSGEFTICQQDEGLVVTEKAMRR